MGQFFKVTQAFFKGVKSQNSLKNKEQQQQQKPTQNTTQQQQQQMHHDTCLLPNSENNQKQINLCLELKITLFFYWANYFLKEKS